MVIKVLNESTKGSQKTLHPRSAYQLINPPFYTVAMNEMIKSSLLSAVENGVYAADAYKALSRLALLEEDSQVAVNYFLKAKPVANYLDNSEYFLQLGRLYLMSGKTAEAEEAFLDSLNTTKLAKRMDEIWVQYKKEKQYKPFLDFCKSAEKEKMGSSAAVCR